MMAVSDKKQFRKNIETKLAQTFAELTHSADRKFKKLVKKVSRLLADGLHHKPKKEAHKKIPIAKKNAKKSSIVKNAPKPPQKSAVKK